MKARHRGIGATLAGAAFAFLAGAGVSRADDVEALTRIGRTIDESALLSDDGTVDASERRIYATSAVASLAEGGGLGFSGAAMERNRQTLERIRERQSSISDLRSNASSQQWKLAEMPSRMMDQQFKLMEMRSRMSDQQMKLFEIRSRMGDQQMRLAEMRSRAADQQWKLSQTQYAMQQRALDQQLRMFDLQQRLSARDVIQPAYRGGTGASGMGEKLIVRATFDGLKDGEKLIRRSTTSELVRSPMGPRVAMMNGVGGTYLSAWSATNTAIKYTETVGSIWKQSSPATQSGSYVYRMQTVNGYRAISRSTIGK